MQLTPEKFDRSKLVMIFLTNLGVAGLLYHFRLLLERKGGKEIPTLSRLEFLENFFFALSDAEDNTSGPLNRRGIVDLHLSRILLPTQKSQVSQASGK